MATLTGKKVAILTDNGFEESELTSPKQELELAGARVDIISLQEGKIKGWKDGNWTIDLNVDINLLKANADDYDALVIPGGVINPDKMRQYKEYVEFARHFLESGKPVAAICHGPQLLIETGLLEGRVVTSVGAIKTDLQNAGAQWIDEEVAVDNGLVTSRTPKDLPAFNKKLIEEIKEGVHSTAAHTPIPSH